MWLVSSHPTLFIISSLLCVLSFISFFFLFKSNRKVKDTLPLFRQFFSSAFSLTYVSLASMKLPPDVLRYSPCHLLFFIQTCCLLKHIDILSWVDRRHVASSPCLFSVTHFYTSCLHRALLTGLTSNPHINDLHLDISGCEVRVHLYICKESNRDSSVFSPHPEWGLFISTWSFKVSWKISSSYGLK